MKIRFRFKHQNIVDQSTEYKTALIGIFIVLICSFVLVHNIVAETKPLGRQYKHQSILIPPASADEAKRVEFSVKAAAHYLEKSSLAWIRSHRCVSCHTPGTYMQIMPELTPVIGKPQEEIHEFFINQFDELKNWERERFEKGSPTGQMIYIASGLAEWDRHVAGNKLSSATDKALRFVFRLQRDNGTWQSETCWPPFESSAYQAATVVARAASAAPGWLTGKAVTDKELSKGVDKLVRYLKTTQPPHDYGRVLLLWTGVKFPGIIKDSTRSEIIGMIWERQRQDGGWSIRDFGKPEQWGKGNRAAKLNAEQEYSDPPSDGHMTGLVVLVLLEAGLSSTDVRIQKAVKWMLENQRESGRWWTRSLNTDKFHFITYSGTAYPLLALARCGVLKEE